MRGKQETDATGIYGSPVERREKTIACRGYEVESCRVREMETERKWRFWPGTRDLPRPDSPVGSREAVRWHGS
jgi:hypothetical protein